MLLLPGKAHAGAYAQLRGHSDNAGTLSLENKFDFSVRDSIPVITDYIVKSNVRSRS
jgi:hypothetical protein